ncbi:hypothetical protein LINGRAHAP2_LOCUS2706, partial [Linum grandiflorum]
MVGPVICILTAIIPRNPPDPYVWLQNTAATRIICPPHHPTFRCYFDMFSHNHIPIRLVSPTSARCSTFLRSPLPRKLTLAALISERPILPPKANETVWCFIRIVHIQHHASNLDYDYGYPSYAIVARCSDATAVTAFLFSGTSANMLLKLTASEYADLPPARQQEVLNGLRGHIFIIETRSLG